MKEIAIIGAAYLTFALAKNLTDPSPVLKAVTNGWGVIRLESALLLDHEPFIQQIISRISTGLLIALTYFYAVGMWLGLIVTAAVLFIKNRAAYIQLRQTFMLTMVLGAIVFAVYPLAPPRFMPGLGIADTVTLLGLDPAPHSDSAISYNRFAAMPSLHYAWALLVMIGAFKIGGKWVVATGITFQVLMFFAIIATGNHYILDALAGALLLLVALYILRQWRRHDDEIGQWASERVQPFVKKRTEFQHRLNEIELPNLRENLLSGFILRGGHAVQPRYTSINLRGSALDSLAGSFHPELDDLSLVLR